MFISAIICTRNRPGDAARSVASVLLNDYAFFEVIVVDQSTGNATRQALKQFHKDERLRVLRSRQTGLARARNQAAGAARGEVLAFTDDDCEVAANWLWQIDKAFAQPGIQLLFGRVEAAAHDAEKGFVTSYNPQFPRLSRTITDRVRSDGIGACMAVRRSSWKALHGFDEQFGAGGRLRAAEDNDFALTALAANYPIYETPLVHVVHHGIRAACAHDRLVSNYMFGTGAMFAKHVRLRSRGIVLLLARVAWRWAFSRSLVAYSTSPKRIFRVRAFLAGFVTGWRTPLDRQSRQFKGDGVSETRYTQG